MYILSWKNTMDYLKSIKNGISQWSHFRKEAKLFESNIQIKNYIIENNWSSEESYKNFMKNYVIVIFLHPLNCKN